MAPLYARSPAQALWVDELSQHIVPTAGVAYGEDDPIVRAHPWAFASADELADDQAEAAATIEKVKVPEAPKAAKRGPIRTRSRPAK